MYKYTAKRNGAKKVLLQEELQEIYSLHGKISAPEVQQKFGIGATRLYRIWNAPNADPEVLQELGNNPKGGQTSILQKRNLSIENPTPQQVENPMELQINNPTVVDFYIRLGEQSKILAEQSKAIARLEMSMVEIQSILDEEISSLCGESGEKEATDVFVGKERENEEGTEKTQFDMHYIGEKVGQIQNLIKISMGLAVAYSMLCKTWKHCQWSSKNIHRAEAPHPFFMQ